MNQSSLLKIDAYSHIVPPKYRAVLSKIAPEQVDNSNPTIAAAYDLDLRFRIMDKFEPIRQVLTLGSLPLTEFSPTKAAELARQANDDMAELVLKYPDRFVAAIASLPMNNIDAALEETDRAINDLKLKGVYIHTPISDKPLDSPEFLPLYEKMSRYDLPIFTHPVRPLSYPDYRTEDVSRYAVAAIFGWPYETTVAMVRLVHSGIMEKYPGLKIVTHHCGGMVPYYAGRLKSFSWVAEQDGVRIREKGLVLMKEPIDYYKMFYNDLAVHGNKAALECAYAFFGAEHLLFGADFPLGDVEMGEGTYRETLKAVEEMNITEAERKRILADNARSLMHLSI
jgi:predicted TIM-barrel fold metal-dependent hydrolase